MMPFEALEVIGRERREALATNADNHRLTPSPRPRTRRTLVSKVSSLTSSIRRARPGFRRRRADWDMQVGRQAQRAT